MAKYDVIIIGAGPGGLCNAAILAKNNKKVLVVEKEGRVGGRAIGISYKGHTLNLGWRQIEETGSGLTKVYEYVGKELKHGPMADNIPIWIDGKWQSLQDMLVNDRDDFRKIIGEISAMSWEDIDKMDDQIIRPWIRKRTQSEGILHFFETLALYEGTTIDWWDHSLSEQLFVRKLHFTEKGMGGYCFNPVGGWFKIWEHLADAIRENGGEIRLNCPAKDILIENGSVQGVEIPIRAPIPTMATDYPETEIVEAPCVISTLGVWDALKIVDESDLPGWYVDQIKFMAKDDLRSIWLGLYASLPEPLNIVAEREMPGWFVGPHSGLAGLCSVLTPYDPTLSPPGEYLLVAQLMISHEHLKSRRVINKLFVDYEKDMEALFPVYKNRLWSQKHVVFNPTYSTAWKPCTVGTYRPDVDVPAVEGLYFGGDTFRSRSVGVDRSARIAMTISEKILGRAILEFKDSFHY